MSSQQNRNFQICYYGEKCYRKNPIHFGEYSHPHLDRIYSQGRDPNTNEYNIPENLEADIISIQLTLLEKIFPHTNSKQREHDIVVDSNTQSYECDQPLSSTNSRKIIQRSTSSSNDSISSKRRNIHDYIPVVLKKGIIAQKLKKAAPYNFFLTAVTASKATHTDPLTITFQELLDNSLGEIESSVQINFMVDVGWLLGQYFFANISDTPLLVLYGEETPELKNVSKFSKNVTAIKIKMPTPFSTSHTKMMLFAYKDKSMRVVISTANLYEDDWDNRTQGLWISPKLPALPDDADSSAGECPTNFKQDLMLYLVEYKLTQLQQWISRIRKSDFKNINVFFIGSVPGTFRGSGRDHPWGHAKLGSLLEKHSSEIKDNIPIVCQSSSIGSLGGSVQNWIQEDFLNSLKKHSKMIGIRQFPNFKMIYPSFNNVQESHDGILGGGCLPYSRSTDQKQPWLKNYLYQWRSSLRHRTRAMPHIKTYTRFDLNKQEIFWFLLTSANLSKAAWGTFNKKSNIDPGLRIANYEAGVLFIPRFIINEETFPLGYERNGVSAFPIPYDVPLSPYNTDDKPFLMDYLTS